MHNDDPEFRAIALLAKYEGLVEQVEAIKSAQDELTDRLDELQEQIDLQDLQKQIFRLSDTIDNVAKNLLRASQYLAESEIEFQSYALCSWANQYGHNDLIEHFLIKTATDKQKARQSIDPIGVANDFLSYCHQYCKERGYQAYRGG